MSGKARTSLQEGQSLGRYRLEKRIGAGAFGEVWLATDLGAHGFQRAVALKVLARNVSERRITALAREARICGHLNHPNIISVYGVEQEDELNFIVMEYVEGETLASMWSDLEFMGARVPRSIILDVGIALCEALHHAWSATNEDGERLRIVHRDLKPANVMIANRGILKVGDFGVAKVAPDLDVQKTRAGKLKGTPSYLAPELWRGDRNFRPGMDLWSLGIILWELATAKRFYAGARTLDIYKIIKKRTVDEEVAAVHDYMPQLDEILRKLLKRDPDERYQDALEVAEQLRWVRMKQPVSGDLLQFVRLIRAGRVDPEERSGSISTLPALPEWLDDWQPLFAMARVKTPPEPAATAEPEGAGKTAILGPGGAGSALDPPSLTSWRPDDGAGAGVPVAGSPGAGVGPPLLARDGSPSPTDGSDGSEDPGAPEGDAELAETQRLVRVADVLGAKPPRVPSRETFLPQSEPEDVPELPEHEGPRPTSPPREAIAERSGSQGGGATASAAPARPEVMVVPAAFAETIPPPLPPRPVAQGVQASRRPATPEALASTLLPPGPEASDGVPPELKVTRDALKTPAEFRETRDALRARGSGPASEPGLSDTRKAVPSVAAPAESRQDGLVRGLIAAVVVLSLLVVALLLVVLTR